VSKDPHKISAVSAEQAPSPSAGLRPSFYEVFDPKASSAVRVEKIHQWLSLPARNRPELIMAYFDTVDYQSHYSGPDDEKVACTSPAPMMKDTVDCHSFGPDVEMVACTSTAPMMKWQHASLMTVRPGSIAFGCRYISAGAKLPVSVSCRLTLRSPKLTRRWQA
jgi:hypothetical protein